MSTSVPTPSTRPERTAAPATWRRLAAWRPSQLAAVLVAAILSVPIVYVALSLTRPAGEIWDHVLGVLVPRYAWTSLELAIGVGLACLLTGTATAWLVTMCRFPSRRVAEWLLVTPLAIPSYVLAYVYLEMLAPGGPVARPWSALTGTPLPFDVASTEGAVLILGLALYPYVYVLTRSAFLQRSRSFGDVARTLGIGVWSAFLRVSLPLARPAIVAGVALVLMETMADFGAVSLLGVQTFTTGVYKAWFSMGDPASAARVAALLLLGVAALVLLERRARAAASYQDARTQRAPTAFQLSGWRAAGAIVICWLPIVFGFLLPVGRLAFLSLSTNEGLPASAFWELITTSVTVAVGTAIIAVTLSVVLAYAARQRQAGPAAVATRIAGFGYAVPGPVIAIGTLLPLAALDRFVFGITASLGLETGLVLTGSLAALIYAYLVRFTTVGLGAVESGLGMVRPSVDAAAALLGAGFLRRLIQIHVPLIWPALLSALLLVTVDVMKELPATLVLRPFDFNTLAVAAYDFARDERLREAAAPSLVLAGLGIIPVLLLIHSMRRRKVAG